MKKLLNLICITILGLSIMEESVLAFESEVLLEAEPVSYVQEIEEPEVETKILGNGFFEIEIINLESFSDVKNVYVPVWNSSDQSDICWYMAEKQDDGKYLVNANIKNHAYHTGNYKIHVYIQDSNGDMNHILSSNMTIPGMSVGSFYDVENEYSRTLILENVESQGIAQKVYFAVWGTSGGQNDLVWYEADANGSTYSAEMMYFNHNEVGTYNVHAYISGKDGSMTHTKTLIFNVEELPEEKIEVVHVDEENGQMEIRFYLNRRPGTVAEVQLPTWTKPDQSDICWYTADWQSDGTYKVMVDVKNHEYHLGNYIMHGYVKDSDGNMQMIDSAHCSVELSAGDFSTSLNSNGYSIRLNLNKAKTQGIAKKVYFAVWSNSGGQDDLVWYEADANGSAYSEDIMFYNHKDVGIYHAHVYVVDRDENMHLLQEETFYVENIPEETVNVVSVDNVNGQFDVGVYVNRPENSIKTVYLAAWSKSDQSDICWYTATRQSDGSYLVNGALSNHNYNTGIYHLHAYVQDANGNMNLIDTSSCTMQFSIGDFYVAEDYMEYSKRLVLSDVYAQGAASEVYFAVWSAANGQDDLIWYETSSSGMNYVYDVILYNHKEVGDYYAHAYMKDRNGQMNFLKAMTFNVDEFEMPKDDVIVGNLDEEHGEFDVTVYVFKNQDEIEQVYVPVWTKSDQRDIVWYVADRQENGSYKVTVDALNHKWNSGEYKIHTYVKNMQGQMVFVKATSVNVQLPELPYEVSPYKIENFPIIYQNPELPTGCEITALTMVLRYYGYNVDKTVMAAEYLPTKAYSLTRGEDGKMYGPDMDNYFVGNPFTSGGWICGPGALVTAANDYLSDVGSSLRARDITGVSFEDLYKRVSIEQPVVVMSTIGNANRNALRGWYTTDGKWVESSTNDHGVVLIGWDETTVRVACPIYGMRTYSRGQFEKIFATRGHRAVILE